MSGYSMVKPFANRYGWKEEDWDHSGYRWVIFSKGPDAIILRLTKYPDDKSSRTDNSVIDATVYYIMKVP